MAKIVKDTIHAQVIDIGIYTADFENEFICLTDIAKYKSDDPTAVIQNWMRNRDVLDFLGLWETLHNSNFKPLEFEGFRSQAGANAFTMSPKKWTDATEPLLAQNERERDEAVDTIRQINGEKAALSHIKWENEVLIGKYSGLWAEFESAEQSRQRAILRYFIQKIEISRGYSLEISYHPHFMELFML